MLQLKKLSFSGSGFCWQFVSDNQNVLQIGYRLQVALDADFTSLLWDSGHVFSEQSTFVPYAGSTLPSCTTVYWRVQIEDNHGEHSGWSHTQKIMTSPNDQDWEAVFITPDKIEEADSSQGKLIRTQFFLDGNIANASVYVTALGMYELYINGQRVGDALLTPGWTEYDKRLLFQTWDVTSYLNSGENAVGAMLGAGWFKGDLAGWCGLRNFYGNRNALFMQLHVNYLDGRKQIVCTDPSWKYANAPIQYAELYHGEVYDARLEQQGWCEAGYDSSNWTAVQVLEYPLSTLRAQDGPLVRRQEVLGVQRVITTPKGETVLDFGQNLAGWVRFKVKGRSGDIVKLHHAEVLDRDGNFYTENMRGARNEILYTLRGGDYELFEPHFTFQGFRYVRIEAWPGEWNAEHFQAVVIHSDMEPTGSFTCSHALLNQLHHNIVWGLKGNFIDIPTDCPQRDERLGWTGDAQVFIRTATYLMDTREFFIKWLRDLHVAQFPNGGVPFVVPDVLTGNFPEGDIISNAESVSGWGDAAVICPWTLWLAYGDVSILRECYNSMKAWVEYIRVRADNGLVWSGDYQLGDWVALDAKEGSYFGATDTDLIATAYYAKCTEILAKTATILGYSKDSEQYLLLRENIGKAYAKQFFSHTGELSSPTQTAHILSLAFNLTPDVYKPSTVHALLQLLEENDGHLTTGFLGTPYFCQVLADNGCLEAAYKLLLKEEYPSWLYQVTKGATTVWEHWDGIKPDGSMWSANMNSFNHYAYGSVGEFFYRTIAGIDVCDDMPGYKKIRIQPAPGGELTSAHASVLTPYGLVSTQWSLVGKCFWLKTEIPPNTTASVVLPDASQHEIGSGIYEFSCAFTM